jgi:AraC-like DNA-binding protein
LALEYALPAESLRSSLSVYAYAYFPEHRIETLPAMLPNIHIRIAGASRYRFGEGSWIAAPAVTIIGPTTGSYQAELQPGTELLATGVLPQGWMSLIRAPGIDMSNGLIDGELLWGRRAVENLCDALSCAPDSQARTHVLNTFFAASVRGSARSPATARTIDHWLEYSPTLSLDALCAELDITARHLRRLTLDLYGMSPKTLAMKYRCLRGAAALAVHGEAGLDTALRGFADQAHLSRDFRRFIGWAPVSFARENRSIAAATFAGRLRAGATRPLVLLS